MFRCRLFHGQNLLLTREYRDDRLDRVVESHGLGKIFAGGDRSRLLRVVRLRSAAGRNAGTASPIPRR